VAELNAPLYGDSKQAAIQRAQPAAREIVLDRIAHGAKPPGQEPRTGLGGGYHFDISSVAG
jgi:hypothetical protein